MTDRVQLDWFVPSDEWGRFVESVRRETGEDDPELGRAVDRAMREYLDRDRFAEVERRVDRLIRAAGRTPADAGEKKRFGSSFGPETERVLCYVDARLKDAFSAYIKEETDDRLGIGLARALREQRDGGRAGRLVDKLDRVEDDATALLAELDEDADGLTGREKKRLQIRRRLPVEFTHADLVAEIEAVAGETVVDDYVPKVLDDLDYAERPATRDRDDVAIYVPAEQAEAEARERAEERKRDAETDAQAALDRHATAADQDDSDPEPDVEPDADGPADADAEAPEVSTAVRVLIEDLGGDPDDPDHVRAFTDDDRDLDDVLADADQEGGADDLELAEDVEADPDPGGDDLDADAPDAEPDPEPDADDGTDDGPEPVALADGGIVATRAPPDDAGADRPGVPPTVTCPCCGAVVPGHVEVEVRDGVAVKDCPRCRKGVDLAGAADLDLDPPTP